MTTPVAWAQFMVAAVSETTTAVGLSEFAVFSAGANEPIAPQATYAPPPGA